MFAILIVVCILQIYVDIRHPKYEKYLRTIHYHGQATAQLPSKSLTNVQPTTV